MVSQSIRSLAAEAGVPVRECLRRLGGAGLGAAVGGQRLEGQPLADARAALGLDRRRPEQPRRPPASPRRELGPEEVVVRLLRPLREKGKVGPHHTTPAETVWGHGVPDHRKAEAKELVEALLREGCLAEKESQGRRHVWLTGEGRARLRRLEAGLPAEGGGGAP
jgi:hypothetical protein